MKGKKSFVRDIIAKIHLFYLSSRYLNSSFRENLHLRICHVILNLNNVRHVIFYMVGFFPNANSPKIVQMKGNKIMWKGKL